MADALATYFSTALPYEAYINMMAELAETGKTTGPKQSENLIGYTKLNFRRMKRNEKTLRLLPESLAYLTSLSQPLNWLVITESWCGDAAQIIPVFQKIADASPFIELRMILRDENLELMDQYLTAGGRSIPKLIAFSPLGGKALYTWGPRPAVAQQMVLAHKENPVGPYQELQKAIQLWYNQDKGKSTQLELLGAARATPLP